MEQEVNARVAKTTSPDVSLEDLARKGRLLDVIGWFESIGATEEVLDGMRKSIELWERTLGGEKMNYRYCTKCGREAPVGYNFELTAWVCLLCGAEIIKPEDEVEKVKKLQVGWNGARGW